MHLSGGCLCGQASYTVDAQPLATALCHCRHCQKQSGSAFAVNIVVPTRAVDLKGELKTYDDVADSGAILHRRFCPECGSPLFSIMAGAPKITIIKAGTLNDVSELKPQFQIWCDSAQPWIERDQKLREFAGNAPT